MLSPFGLGLTPRKTLGRPNRLEKSTLVLDDARPLFG